MVLCFFLKTLFKFYAINDNIYLFFRVQWDTSHNFQIFIII